MSSTLQVEPAAPAQGDLSPWTGRRAAAPEAPAASARPVRALLALAALALVLLYPIATPAHVEGFSASIASLGLHVADGTVWAYDPVFPVNQEFFGLSRLGAVLGVAALTRAGGLGTDAAMRVIMWAGFAGLWLASWVLVRRWARASGLVAAAALLLMPGAYNSAFFYNDNVLAAALGVGALAVLACTAGVAPAAGAGVLFGLGVVTRTDTVLIGAAVPLLLFERHGRSRAFVGRAAAFGLAALVPVVGVYGAFHATFLDVVAVTNYAVWLWSRDLSLGKHLQEAAYFVGLPAGVLIVAGVAELARRRAAARALLLVGVPLVFNVVALGKLWQARQLAPLTPFLAALVALGWRALVPRAGRGSAAGRAALGARAAVAVLAVVVLLAPRAWRVKVDDGPRSLRGLLWASREWRHWQDAVNTDMDALRAFATSLGTGRGTGRTAVVLADRWNPDRYLHLALQEAGFSVVRPAALTPACAQAGEVFTRGARRVVLVRLHIPFLRSFEALAPRRLATYGLPCLDAVQPADLFLLSTVGRVRGLARGIALDDTTSEGATSELGVSWAHADSVSGRSGYEPHAAIRVDSASLGRIRAAYERESALYIGRGMPGALHPIDVEVADRLLASRVPFR